MFSITSFKKYAQSNQTLIVQTNKQTLVQPTAHFHGHLTMRILIAICEQGLTVMLSQRALIDVIRWDEGI